jgi:hypothetical protein
MQQSIPMRLKKQPAIQRAPRLKMPHLIKSNIINGKGISSQCAAAQQPLQRSARKQPAATRESWRVICGLVDFRRFQANRGLHFDKLHRVIFHIMPTYKRYDSWAKQIHANMLFNQGSIFEKV